MGRHAGARRPREQGKPLATLRPVKPGLTALALCFAAILGGCGGSGTSGTPTDRALACVSDAGLAARKVSVNTVQVGKPGVGPRIVITRYEPEAESTQLSGKAEGAEQIGPALLYVNRGSDAELLNIERCLEKQAD